MMGAGRLRQDSQDRHDSFEMLFIMFILSYFRFRKLIESQTPHILVIWPV